MDDDGVSAGLRTTAVVLVGIAVVQTLLDARLGVLSWWSAVLTAVTAAVVLVPRTPRLLLWLVLVADAALVARFSWQLPSPLMGLFYATVLLPYTTRVVAVALVLPSRRRTRARTGLDPGTVTAAQPAS